jgi:glycosyltransferase involved in cell wall biosynthesis
MVPLYLPPTLDEKDESWNVPIFFGGISVYLEQKLPFFRYLPRFVHRWLASRKLLKIIGSRAAATHPSHVGELTVSMLQGKHGHQSRELDELCRWLKTEHRPDIVSFSNLLLLGMHAQIKAETKAKTVCMLTGEDAFLDALAEPFRDDAWNLIRRYTADVDVLIAPSRYFAEYMEKRLELQPGRIQTVYPGINLDGFDLPTHSADNSAEEPVLGYFARLNRGKGLDTLVDAFIEIRRRNRFPTLKLKIGGGCSAWDTPFLKTIRKRIGAVGLESDTVFQPDVSREEKIAFLKSLTLFSVPSRLNEAFGFFVLESQAAGVPGIFPNRGAFPEILAETQGGILYEPENFNSLADSVEKLLADEPRRRQLSQNARSAVRERFAIDLTAKQFLDYVKQI